MSYTAPQYVDTKEQAVLALASTIAGEDKTALGNGSVNKALDVLADVLAQQDVSVPQTNAGAILALAQYASGMVKPEGTITITENGEGIDVAQYATADVSVSGGGGDFSTCTVKITNESTKDFIIAVPNLYGAQLYSGVDSADMDGSDFEIVLYSGNGISVLMSTEVVPPTPSGTGGVEVNNGSIYITGDGTLTFSD